MTSLNVLNNMLAPPKYRDADFAHLSANQLQKLHSAFPGHPMADAALEVIRLKYIEGRKKDDVNMFKLYMSDLRQRKRKGQILETAKIEESAYAKGSKISYSKATITVVTKAGDKTIIPNAVVPDPNVPARPHGGTLVAFLCRAVLVDGGELKPSIDDNTQFKDAFGAPNSSISISGMGAFGIMAVQLIKQDLYWKSLAPQDRIQLTGSKFIAFTSRFVNSCEWKTFWALQTLIVVKALRVFSSYSKDRDGKMRLGHIVKYEKKPVIPTDAYSYSKQGKIPESWGLVGDQLKGAQECMAFLGVVAVYYRKAKMFQNSVSQKEPKLIDVRKCIQDGDSLRGGNRSATAILSSCDGFSGVPTPATREAHFFFALACAAVIEHDAVDIHLPSVGHLDTMISTLLNGRAFLFPSGEDENAIKRRIKLILPFESFPIDERRLWCSSTPRIDAFHVIQSNRSAPTFGPNVTAEQVELAAETYMRGAMGYAHFAFICHAFGEYPWGQKLYVYRYGTEGDFSAVVSTSPSLTLVGTGPERAGIIYVPLKKIDNRADFFRTIVRDNLRKNAYFLVPTSHYSPISNLISVTTKGIVTTAEDIAAGELDDFNGWTEKGNDAEDAEGEEEGVAHDEPEVEGGDEDDDDGMYASMSDDDDQNAALRVAYQQQVEDQEDIAEPLMVVPIVPRAPPRPIEKVPVKRPVAISAKTGAKIVPKRDTDDEEDEDDEDDREKLERQRREGRARLQKVVEKRKNPQALEKKPVKKAPRVESSDDEQEEEGGDAGVAFDDGFY